VPAFAGAILIATALVLLDRAGAGVRAQPGWLGPTPVTAFYPADLAPGERLPTVVIAHGFAGSQELMRSFALTLARNGYLAITFDFYGHGRNQQPLSGNLIQVDGATGRLVSQLDDVVAYALAHPRSDGRLALLGHSMATDVIIRYALAHPQVAATVALSMFSPAVTATQPGNLLIIAGALETRLKAEALRAVGMVTQSPSPATTYGSFATGTARRAFFADGVEHVGVLFSPESLAETVQWLDNVFGHSGSGAIASRGGPILALLLGLLICAWPLSRLLPRVSAQPLGAALRGRSLWLAALLPAVLTPLLLSAFPADFLSLLVGGYLAVHFGVYGVLSAALLWWLGRRQRTHTAPARQRRISVPRLLVATLLATAYAAGLIDWALDSEVTAFAVTRARYPLVLLMLLGTGAYFLADEWLTRGPAAPGGAQWLTRTCFVGSLGLAVALSFEDLFFLLIIAAIIALYFLFYGLLGRWIYRATGHPAVGAIANAVAFAWALAVVFPMLSG
jgi:pimeloyl-ACP methyl ester carboxylesterase